jgi:hypothetical protein
LGRIGHDDFGGYALFLVVSWHVGVPTVMQASLGTIAVPSGGQYVMATILGTCLLSFAITHLLYFCAVGEEIGALISRLRHISFSS